MGAQEISGCGFDWWSEDARRRSMTEDRRVGRTGLKQKQEVNKKDPSPRGIWEFTKLRSQT